MPGFEVLEPDTRSRWERLDERYSNNENANVLWATEYKPPAPQWELAFTTTLTNWLFGISGERQYGSRNWESAIWVTIGFGPFALTVTRTWGRGQ